MGVWVVGVSTQSLHHERRGWLYAVKQTRVHDARHLWLQNVLCTLYLLVGEMAERRKIVTAHRLRDADRRVAETVADGNVRLLVTGIENFLCCDAMDHSIQMACITVNFQQSLSLYLKYSPQWASKTPGKDYKLSPTEWSVTFTNNNYHILKHK